MKRIILAAVAVSALAVSPAAFAASASATVAVGGTVTGSCGNGNQSGGGVASPSVVALGELVNANGQLSVAEQSITFGNTWCNGPATLTVAVSDLDSGITPLDASSFVGKLRMVVTGKMIDTYMGGGSADSDTDKVATIGQAFETGTGQYASGKLNVTLPTGTVGNDRPVAGTYSGTVTFTATPN